MPPTRPLAPLQWYPEVNHFCKKVPIIVVGCKTDLRKDKSLVNKLRRNGLEPVTYHRVGNPARGGSWGGLGEGTSGCLSVAPGVQNAQGVGQSWGRLRGCQRSETSSTWKWSLEYSGSLHRQKGEQGSRHIRVSSTTSLRPREGAQAGTHIFRPWVPLRYTPGFMGSSFLGALRGKEAQNGG